MTGVSKITQPGRNTGSDVAQVQKESNSMDNLTKPDRADLKPVKNSVSLESK